MIYSNVELHNIDEVVEVGEGGLSGFKECRKQSD